MYDNINTRPLFRITIQHPLQQLINLPHPPQNIPAYYSCPALVGPLHVPKRLPKMLQPILRNMTPAPFRPGQHSISKLASYRSRVHCRSWHENPYWVREMQLRERHLISFVTFDFAAVIKETVASE